MNTQKFAIIALTSIFISSVFAVAGEPKTSEKTSTYSNARFDFSICYPKDLFTEKPELSDNGDGATLTSKDGKAELRAFGSNNALDQSLAQSLKEYSEGWMISYKTLKKNFYVISGTKDKKIMYQKTFLIGDVFKTFMLTYDQSVKAVYDPVSAQISHCFDVKPFH